MLSFLNSLRDLNFWSVLLRILLATLCGTLIGLERSSKNRPAGFRTHILVCMGGSVAAVTALYLVLIMKLPADVSRLAGQVVTGLGFIGAGTIIITKRNSIKGLTTAAGYYELGILGTAAVLLTETVFGKLSANIKSDPKFVVEILYTEKTALDHVLRLCKDKRLSIVNLQIEALPKDSEAAYSAEVTLRGKVAIPTLLGEIRMKPGIFSADTL